MVHMVVERKRSVCLWMGEQRSIGEKGAKGHKESSGPDGYFCYLNGGGSFEGGYIC